jgi:hypothetical protein
MKLELLLRLEDSVQKVRLIGLIIHEQHDRDIVRIASFLGW